MSATVKKTAFVTFLIFIVFFALRIQGALSQPEDIKIYSGESGEEIKAVEDIHVEGAGTTRGIQLEKAKIRKKTQTMNQEAVSQMQGATEPEDLHPESAPPAGADKLKRSSRKPSIIEKTPQEMTAVAQSSGAATASAATSPVIASGATAPAILAATASAGVAATASVLASAAANATAPVFATSAVSASTASTAVAAGAATSTQQGYPPSVQLPPGAVVVSNEGGKPRAAKGITPYGTIELISLSPKSSGNQVGFLAQNNMLYGYNDKFTQRVNLGMSGKLSNGMNLTGEFRDMPYMDNVFRLSVKNEKNSVDFGDSVAEFRSGEMTSFSKNIRGVSAGYTVGPANIRMLMSSQKSKSQNETFNGRNIRGPYALRANDIIANTEVVRVNGRPMPRSEYMMDYFLGQVTFNRALDPTDSIEISYESALWEKLNSGDLLGVSVTSKFFGDKAVAGVSFLNETTKSNQDARVVSDSRNYTKQYILGFDGVVDLNAGATTKIKLEKNRELVTAAADSGTATLIRPDDYSMDYANAKITFATGSARFAALTATTTITITFNFYQQGFLQLVQDEQLEGDGQIEYKLNYATIYGGTERVYLYLNGALVRQLAAGADYNINEGSNSIVFLDPNAIPNSSFGRNVHISYEIVPESYLATGPEKRQRTVTSLFGNVKLGKTTLGGEAAETKSDVRLKSVQVVEEQVATVVDPHQRDYYLVNAAQYDSVEVYFNDPSAPSSLQRQGIDYLVESVPAPGKTRLNFKRDIPAGTTIVANYRYQPTALNLDDKTGRAVRVTAAGTPMGISVQGEYMLKGPYFAPLTAYNDLENERITASAGAKLGKKISYNFNVARHSYYLNLDSADKLNTNQLGAKFGYEFRKNTTASYTFERRTRFDTLNSHLTSNGLTGHRFDIAYRSNKNFNSAFIYELRSFKDDTLLTSDRDNQRYGASFDYFPKKALKINLALDYSSLRSTPPPSAGMGEFMINTYSTRINTTYKSGGSLALNLNLDSQNITDSREGSAHGKLDSIDAQILGIKGFSFMKDYLISFNRQDRPDPVFGDSRTDIATVRTTVRAASQVVVIPSVVVTNANVGDGSVSRDNSRGLRVEYRSGARRGVRSAAGYTTSSRSGMNTYTSSTATSFTAYSTKQSQISLNVDYMPSDRMTATVIYLTTGSDSETVSQTQDSYTMALDYFMNEITSLRLMFNTEKNPPSGNLATWQFGMKRKIDKNFDLDLGYKNQRQSGDISTAFRGSMLTMRMLASF